MARQAAGPERKRSECQIGVDAEASVISEERHTRQQRTAGTHEEVGQSEPCGPHRPKAYGRGAQPKETEGDARVDSEDARCSGRPTHRRGYEPKNRRGGKPSEVDHHS